MPVASNYGTTLVVAVSLLLHEFSHTIDFRQPGKTDGPTSVGLYCLRAAALPIEPSPFDDHLIIARAPESAL